MALRVRYPQVTGQVYDALGIYDTYNRDFGILVAVRLFLGGSNTYSDPIPVEEVDVIGGLAGGGGVSSINSLVGNLSLVAGSGIDISPSGNSITITATGGGSVTDEVIDDRVAALLQAGTGIALTYNDAANTLTISSTGGGGGVSSFNGRTGAVLPQTNDYAASQIAGLDSAIDNRIAVIASTVQPADLFPAFNENVDDRANALIVAGTGITKVYNDAANTLTLSANVALLQQNYILLVDQKPAGVNAGTTFAGGVPTTRVLNTEVVDQPGAASLSNNKITLEQGTYQFRIRVPGRQVGNHKARLYNVTTATTVAWGTSEVAEPTLAAQSWSEINGVLFTGGAEEFEVQHLTNFATVDIGQGGATNFGPEIYTTAEFWKIG